MCPEPTLPLVGPSARDVLFRSSRFMELWLGPTEGRNVAECSLADHMFNMFVHTCLPAEHVVFKVFVLFLFVDV